MLTENEAKKLEQERKAIITFPYKSMDALNGLAGTIIKYK